MNPVHCLTFDVLEHFQAPAFDSPMRRRHWDQCESRVAHNTQKLLELLEAHRATATFFLVGWVAERCPQLVRDICQGGHEVAALGYANELIMTQTPARFREDVRKTKAILEHMTGQRVDGYRAPGLTIPKDCEWALTVLTEEGYRYDSSLLGFPAPCANGRTQESRALCIETKAGAILELSPSIGPLPGWKISLAGGTYFRLLPYWLVRHCIKKAGARGVSAVLRLQSWEFDPTQPRMQGAWHVRFRHYHNLDKSEPRLVALLSEFQFQNARDLLEGSPQDSRVTVPRRQTGREPVAVMDMEQTR